MQTLSRFAITLGVILMLVACETAVQKNERLAKQHCSSCHAFPDPSLLDKTTWREQVMPQMAFRMGFDNLQMLMQMPEGDQQAVMATLPTKPMLSEEEFERIQEYYQQLAPDSIAVPDAPEGKIIKQFDITPFRLPLTGAPANTLIKVDTTANKIFIGTRSSRFYTLTTGFALQDSMQLSSPPSDMLIDGDVRQLLLMGIMDPNDQSRGKVMTLSQIPSIIVDSLQRPVHFQYADFNNDGLKDYIICAFGNYTGGLLLYENRGDGTFIKHVLIGLPGARHVIVRDFDNNGLPDVAALLTQGDEKIILLLNQGKFDFRINTLLRFPPVYGSSYFEMHDFNNDGALDILYTNGDNADYSPILKPYHGVRLFLNEGTNRFTESWFYPMHGASQLRAADFDRDGDLDIAAISFFPDFREHPEHSFFYFENKGKLLFDLQTTPLAAKGRWITMETADVDHDRDVDIILGSLNFESGVPTALRNEWKSEKTALLILRNKLH